MPIYILIRVKQRGKIQISKSYRNLSINIKLLFWIVKCWLLIRQGYFKIEINLFHSVYSRSSPTIKVVLFSQYRIKMRFGHHYIKLSKNISPPSSFSIFRMNILTFYLRFIWKGHQINKNNNGLRIIGTSIKT